MHVYGSALWLHIYLLVDIFKLYYYYEQCYPLSIIKYNKKFTGGVWLEWKSNVDFNGGCNASDFWKKN